MGWLTRLFGNIGTVRFEGVSIDGRSFTGKVQIEVVGISIDELEDKLKNILYVEKGIKSSKLKIVGFVSSQS